MSYIIVKLAKPVALLAVSTAAWYGQTKWREANRALKIEGKSKAELGKLFDSIDEDGNGTIDESELKHALEKAGVHMSHMDLKSMINSADENHDGKISKEEFLHICVKIQSPKQH